MFVVLSMIAFGVLAIAAGLERQEAVFIILASPLLSALAAITILWLEDMFK